jgi:O-antigen/teichoic acid export membrane protein
MTRATPASAPISLRQRAVEGVAWAGAQSVLSRIVMLVAQIILGWLLTPAEFGISALAGTISALAWSFENFGSDEVLVQRGRTILKWEKAVFCVSVGAALLTLCVLILLGPLVAQLFNEPQIAWLIYLSGGGILISSTCTVSFARMCAALDFRWLNGMNLFVVVVGQLATVLFALTGFGAASFFLATLVQQTVRAILVLHRAPPRFAGKLNLRQIKAVIGRSTYVFFSRISEAILAQADYFILGLFAATGVVGIYTFAFRLAAVPVRIVATNLRNVLMPTLTALKGDVARQDRASLDAAEILAYTVTPLCLFQAAIAETALLLLFGEKWQASVPILQILSIGLAAEAILSIARARMSALGEFARAMRIACLSVVAFVIMVSIGASIGRDIGAATAVALFSLIVSPVVFFHVFKIEGGWPKAWFEIYLRPMLTAGAPALVAFALVQSLEKVAGPLLTGIAGGIVCCAGYAAALYFTNRPVFGRLMGLFTLMRGRMNAR